MSKVKVNGSEISEERFFELKESLDEDLLFTFNGGLYVLSTQNSDLGGYYQDGAYLTIASRGGRFRWSHPRDYIEFCNWLNERVKDFGFGGAYELQQPSLSRFGVMVFRVFTA